jgi:hypothetical protein
MLPPVTAGGYSLCSYSLIQAPCFFALSTAIARKFIKMAFEQLKGLAISG